MMKNETNKKLIIIVEIRVKSNKKIIQFLWILNE